MLGTLSLRDLVMLANIPERDLEERVRVPFERSPRDLWDILRIAGPLLDFLIDFCLYRPGLESWPIGGPLLDPYSMDAWCCLCAGIMSRAQHVDSQCCRTLQYECTDGINMTAQL
jgi:hypothetical protein